MAEELDYSAYKIDMEMFSGPMDLLLYLIRREEVEIHEIPIAKIADQYLEYMEMIEGLDLSLAGDFLIVAATLMEIKSRSLLPSEDLDDLDDDEDDPSSELVARLLEYKKFKDASRFLSVKGEARRMMFTRPHSVVKIRPEWIAEELEGKDPLEGVTLWDLLNAFTKVMEQAKPIEHAKVTYEDVPLPVYFGRITALLEQKSPLAFESLFEKANHRGELIGTFLAILELARLKKIKLIQTENYQQLWIEWQEGAELSDDEVDGVDASFGYERPSYADELDVTRADDEQAITAGASSGEEDIETLRSQQSQKLKGTPEPVDETESSLPGFTPLEENPFGHSDQSTDIVEGELATILEDEEFGEDDEIDRALAAVEVPDLEAGNMQNYRNHDVEPAPEGEPQPVAANQPTPAENN
ncbi:MAG: segregation/condensation protein A [Planctomycetota bacterium]|jgi:segregation and condensation protein A|nr:segregation/condensation protein A [Planctomycetota bacterium]